MIVAETYRRCSAECMRMCRWEESISDKVLFIEMATKWLRLAEFAERRTHKQSTTGFVRAGDGCLALAHVRFFTSVSPPAPVVVNKQLTRESVMGRPGSTRERLKCVAGTRA